MDVTKEWIRKKKMNIDDGMLEVTVRKSILKQLEILGLFHRDMSEEGDHMDIPSCKGVISHHELECKDTVTMENNSDAGENIDRFEANMSEETIPLRLVKPALDSKPPKAKVKKMNGKLIKLKICTPYGERTENVIPEISLLELKFLINEMFGISVAVQILKCGFPPKIINDISNFQISHGDKIIVECDYDRLN